MKACKSICHLSYKIMLILLSRTILSISDELATISSADEEEQSAANELAEMFEMLEITNELKYVI